MQTTHGGTLKKSVAEVLSFCLKAMTANVLALGEEAGFEKLNCQ